MLSKNRISELQSLHQKKFRIQKQKFFAEGKKIVSELISSNASIETLFASQAFISEYVSNSNHYINEIVEVEDFELQKISVLKNPQDALAVCSIPERNKPQWKADGIYLFLDSIRDPGNLGSLIRLSDWFGVDDIIVSQDCVEWTNPKVIQASMGSFIRKQPWVADDNFFSTIPSSISIMAADLEGENLYTDFKGSSGLFIISNEANGLSEYLLPIINHKIHIPTPSSSAESLNAAAAATVIVSELSRRKYWTK